MADTYRKPYLDSSVIIGWLKREVRDVDRSAIGDCIFKNAERGQYEIYISAWSLAEVHKVRGEKTALDSQQSARILQFFEHTYFQLVDVDRGIGEEAHRLCQQYGLQPGDAVHLACALRAGCDVLLTWDGPLSGLSLPDIRIEHPVLHGQAEFELPDLAITSNGHDIDGMPKPSGPALQAPKSARRRGRGRRE